MEKVCAVITSPSGKLSQEKLTMCYSPRMVQFRLNLTISFATMVKYYSTRKQTVRKKVYEDRQTETGQTAERMDEQTGRWIKWLVGLVVCLVGRLVWLMGGLMDGLMGGSVGWLVVGWVVELCGLIWFSGWLILVWLVRSFGWIIYLVWFGLGWLVWFGWTGWKGKQID